MSIYYTLDTVLSYNALINFIIRRAPAVVKAIQQKNLSPSALLKNINNLFISEDIKQN